MPATRATTLDLVEIAQRLAEEFDTAAPGSVLRCVSRALRAARSWGCPQDHLATTTEASARWLMVHRFDPAASGEAPRAWTLPVDAVSLCAGRSDPSRPAEPGPSA